MFQVGRRTSAPGKDENYARGKVKQNRTERKSRARGGVELNRKEEEEVETEACVCTVPTYTYMRVLLAHVVQKYMYVNSNTRAQASTQKCTSIPEFRITTKRNIVLKYSSHEWRGRDILKFDLIRLNVQTCYVRISLHIRLVHREVMQL